MGNPGEPSTTSFVVATGRGLHRLRHARPWVLEDPWSLLLIGPAWREYEARIGGAFATDVQDEAICGVIVRARYVEDRLDEGPFTEHVILGAGLDSTAWRRPDLVGRVRIFELDHPDTQDWKRARADALGLPVHDNHRYVPIDFERDSLADVLAGAGFDAAAPALFSWLGVTMYLTEAAVEATLRFVASCGPGTEIVLTYIPPDEYLDDNSRTFLAAMSALAAAGGEPVMTSWAPDEFEALAVRCGLAVADHPTMDDLRDRYFGGRPDGLRPFTMERVVRLAVP